MRKLTWRVIAEGSNITHREDVAIPALLGITLVTEAVQPSRTSPAMAFDVTVVEKPRDWFPASRPPVPRCQQGARWVLRTGQS